MGFEYGSNASDATLAKQNAILADTIKIDEAAVSGLTGVEDSLAYTESIIARHNHHSDRWLAAAAIPDAEVHVADSISDSFTAFQIDGGNLVFGSWLQILGSDDTPVIVGRTKFDLNEIMVISHERNSNLHLFQLACGNSGDAGLAAGDYSEFGVVTGGGASETGALQFNMPRIPSGIKAWIRVVAVGQNTGTIDFLFGLHEYEG